MTLDRLISQALGAERRGDYVGALKLFREALNVSLESAEAHLGMGRICLYLGHADRAIEAFTHALLLDRDSSEAFEGRGQAMLSMGLFDQARLDLDRAVELAPRRGDHRLARGQLLLEMREIGLARLDLAMAYDLLLGDPDVAIELARAQAMGQNPDGERLAELVAAASQEFGADDPMLRLLGAVIVALGGDEEEARRSVMAAVRDEEELAEDAARIPVLAALFDDE